MFYHCYSFTGVLQVVSKHAPHENQESTGEKTMILNNRIWRLMSTRAPTFHVGVWLLDSSHWWAAGHVGLAGAACRSGRPRGGPARRLLQHTNQDRTVVRNTSVSIEEKSDKVARGINPSTTNIAHYRDFKTLTVAPLVGVAGCFDNKDCRGIKVNIFIKPWLN